MDNQVRKPFTSMFNISARVFGNVAEVLANQHVLWVTSKYAVFGVAYYNGPKYVLR